MGGSSIAARKTDDPGRAQSSRHRHGREAKSVSATKKGRILHEVDEASTISSSGELCTALYFHKVASKGIWWPALRYASVADFQRATYGHWFPQDRVKRRKLKKNLVQRVMKEALGGSPIETLVYLGRPIENYVTANEAMQTGVEIQDLAHGLHTLLQQARNPSFPKEFELVCGETDTLSLFSDYYKGMEEIVKRTQADSDSSDEDSDEEEDSSRPSFPTMGKFVWDEYHKDLPASKKNTEGAPKPVQPQQAQDEEHGHHDDQSIATQSVAAVSYTEASLASKTHCTTPSRPSLPAKLETEVIEPGDDFDTIWYKHQLEGWDQYYVDDEDRMVYKAPNGYQFDSAKDFLVYLKETYGFENKTDRGRSRKPRSQEKKTRNRSTSRSRSRSREKEHGILWSDLWLYLTNTLGWTYNYATREDSKVYGMNTTALWFRPGYDMKHRGQLGKDFFISEDDVLEYCLAQNILPPDREAEKIADDEESDADEPESLGLSSDDPGYTTPDDQSTVPQDPGKPRLPSPSDAYGDSGASSKSGGSYYSYDDDPDRYVFQKLWSRLRAKGWSWCKAKNLLHDYWYVRPASMRPESEWIRGKDYFVTEEELIEFCKQRDQKSQKEREARRLRIRQESLQDEQELRQRQREEERNHRDGEEKKKVKRQKGSSTLGTKNAKGRRSSVPAAGSYVAQNKDNQIHRRKESSKKRRVSGEDNKRREADKKRKGTKGEKSATERRISARFNSCDDDNLKVRDVHAPWATNIPRYEHKLCLEATGMTWAGSFYYLPGENNKGFTVRFPNVEEVAQYFTTTRCAWPSGAHGPSNEKERAFDRLIRYALVPGLQSNWSDIRLITRSETSYLLRKLGYTSTASGTWKPPDALVDAGLLKNEYDSLDALCESLRCLSGDLKTPPNNCSRRARKQNCSVTETQFIALRLRMAEGFTSSDREESGDEADETSSVADSESMDDESEAPEVAVCTDGIKESKKRKRAMNEFRFEEDSRVGNATETTSDFDLEDEEKQIALSPSKIKVDGFGKNEGNNPAPWAINPPTVPVGGWTKLYAKMGITYSSSTANYYLPGESSKSHTIKFSKVDDICVHICKEGDYDKYLERLETHEEKKFLARHFNYANVPGKRYDWRKLRRLELHETITFLTLLGFEKSDGRWKIPEGVPILEESSYSSLSELGKALVRLPDLSDRTKGMAYKRRCKESEDDKVLSDGQMMALRLRIAEGLENEDFSASEDLSTPTKEAKKHYQVNDENDEPLQRYSTDDINQFLHQIGDSKNAWAALQGLGCKYSSGFYRVPYSTSKVDSLNNLFEFLLNEGVGSLDWESCDVKEHRIQSLVCYLKAFFIRCKDVGTIESALRKVTRSNVRQLLSEIGIQEDDGVYITGSGQCSKSEIVNLIRSHDDLESIRDKEEGRVKRRRGNESSLTETKVLILRLWAAFSDVPLKNMPDTSNRVRSSSNSASITMTKKISQRVSNLALSSGTEASSSEENISEDSKAVDDDVTFGENTVEKSNEVGSADSPFVQGSFSASKPPVEKVKNTPVSGNMRTETNTSKAQPKDTSKSSSPRAKDVLEFPDDDCEEQTDPSPGRKFRQTYGSQDQKSVRESTRSRPSPSRSPQKSTSPRHRLGSMNRTRSDSSSGSTTKRCNNPTGLCTQPSFSEHDVDGVVAQDSTPTRNNEAHDSIEAMDRPAQMDFPPFSPLPISYSDRASSAGMLTQVDDSGEQNGNWVDSSLFSFLG